MSALARGPNYYFGPQASVLVKGFAQKFLKIKDMFAIAGGFWTKSDSKVSAAVSRLVLEAGSKVVRWLGDQSGSTQALAPRVI